VYGLRWGGEEIIYLPSYVRRKEKKGKKIIAYIA